MTVRTSSQQEMDPAHIISYDKLRGLLDEQDDYSETDSEGSWSSGDDDSCASSYTEATGTASEIAGLENALKPLNFLPISQVSISTAPNAHFSFFKPTPAQAKMAAPSVKSAPPTTDFPDKETMPDIVLQRMMKCNNTAIQQASAPPKQNKSAPGAREVSPVTYLCKILAEYGASLKDFESAKNYFLSATYRHVLAYSATIAKAARQGDLVTIQRLHRQGQSLQCCNRYGEGLVHIICRRKSVPMLLYVMQQGRVTVRVRDDFGRTPLHDAAWTNTPNFELVLILLKDSPELLMVEDKRGHTPLSYAPKECWGSWREFLDKNRAIVKHLAESKF